MSLTPPPGVVIKSGRTSKYLGPTKTEDIPRPGGNFPSGGGRKDLPPTTQAIGAIR